MVHHHALKSYSYKTIGVCIPCRARHIPLLKNVLTSIQKGTVHPVVVSISISEWDKMPELGSYDFGVRITLHKNAMNAAQNRNVAAKVIMSTVDIITFIDADDAMHPRRLEIIRDTISKHKVDGVAHDYHPIHSALDIDKWKVLPQKIQTLHGVLVKGPSGFGLVPMIPGGGKIHHGHLSVLSTVLEKVTFREDDGALLREDSLFASDLLDAEFRIAYIREPLTNYMGG